MLKHTVLRRLLLYMAFWSVFLSAKAQEPEDSLMAPLPDTTLTAGVADTVAAAPQKRKMGFIRRLIRGFDRLDERYIEPQHYVFAAMIQATHNYDFYRLHSNGPNRQNFSFSPDSEVRIGPYAGWRWVFLGYTFSLNNLSFSSNKRGLDLSIYSSQIGVDLFYHRSGGDYKLREVNLGYGKDYSALEDLSFDGFNNEITGFNIYYIFNHGRFSYPAAFSQSTIQKISCGSWLAGFGYTQNTLEFDYEQLQTLVNEKMVNNTIPLDDELKFQDIKFVDVSLSGGYAYNWVFAKNWLLGGSVQLAVAHKHSTSEMANSKSRRFSFQNINLNGIGRFALVYNNMRWFAGCSVILHTYNYYQKTRFSTNNTFGSVNMYVGINFGLKKKYRENKDE